MKFKRLTSSLLALIITATSIISAYATDLPFDPNAGGGDDTGNIGGGTFDDAYQGFRVTLLNGSDLFYDKESCVDILFSQPPELEEQYTGTLNKLRNANTILRNMVTIPNMPDIKDMPPPLTWVASKNAFRVNGIAIKEYLMTGRTLTGEIAGGGGGNPMVDNTPSGGTGGSGSST